MRIFRVLFFVYPFWGWVITYPFENLAHSWELSAQKNMDVPEHTYTLSGEPTIPWGPSMNPRLRTPSRRGINYQTIRSSSSTDFQKTLYTLADGHLLISIKSAVLTDCTVAFFQKNFYFSSHLFHNTMNQRMQRQKSLVCFSWYYPQQVPFLF